MKSVRSWSQPDNIPNLIGRKQVDWSALHQGATIPVEFIEDFNRANGGAHISRGERKPVVFLVGSQRYEASLENVDRQVSADTYRLMWTGNRGFRSLLAETFSFSLKYLESLRSSKGEDSGNVAVPDNMAEYIEFYRTPNPFEYRVELSPRKIGATVSKFREYVAISPLQFSYKLVLLKALLSRVSHTGFAEISDVASAFSDYYLTRVQNGLTADRQGAAINSIETMSQRVVQTLVLDNPFSAYSRAGWMVRNGSTIGFSSELWTEMTQADREELSSLADERLKDYYQMRVDEKSLKNLLNKVLDGYADARNQHFSGSSEMAGILTREIPQTVTSTGVLSSERYKVRGSAGQGNWASVPWVAIMDRNITETTQSGVYLVYLFSSDMQSIYLSFMQGVTNVVREQPGAAGYELLAQRADKLRDQLDIGDLQWENPQLGNVSLARQYEAGIIAYIKYDKGKLPDDEKLYADFSRMLDLYSQYRGSINVRTDDPDSEIREVRTDYEILGPRGILGRISQYITSHGFQYSYSDLCNFYLSLRTKPFVILAGISGTGKSQLPRLFAKAISANTQPIAVRPDWNDGSDLLGYSDLEGRFRPGALTKLIEQANEDPETPMLVVLDEMNLARVEHYMSDLLSVMETRTITEDGTYTTKSLFGNTEFKDEADADRFGSLTLPDNLYIIGTVNMDETTHPFSKKVLDRANTIEFSDVDLTGYRGQTVEQVAPIVLTNEQLRGKCIHLSHALAEDSEYVDGVVDKLAEVNKVLGQANLHIGYRVRDEVAIYMLYNHQLGLLDEGVAFDYQLMQKILPRLQGSSQPIRRVLVQLLRICGGVDLSNTNDDLLSKLQEFEARGKAKPYPRSAAKLVSMLRRFEEDGFTSYWI